MTRNGWAKEYLELYGGSASDKKVRGAPTWMLELAVRYGRLSKAHGLRTEQEFRMHRLTGELNTAEVKRLSDVWKYMVVRDVEEARTKKKKPEEPEPNMDTAAKRPTAAATVLAMLREVPVRSDAQIIAAVHAATFHDGFNKAQLAWYKGKFKKGELKGQTGPEVIQEVVIGQFTGRMSSVPKNLQHLPNTLIPKTI